jgi:hypothetical protein
VCEKGVLRCVCIIPKGGTKTPKFNMKRLIQPCRNELKSVLLWFVFSRAPTPKEKSRRAARFCPNPVNQIQYRNLVIISIGSEASSVCVSVFCTAMQPSPPPPPPPPPSTAQRRQGQSRCSRGIAWSSRLYDQHHPLPSATDSRHCGRRLLGLPF